MSNTIILGWNRPIPGREKQAMELFQSSLAYWSKKQEAGQISSFEPILAALHGGDMNGFFVVKGDPAKLDSLMHEKDYVELVMSLGIALEGFGAVRGYSGERLSEIMQSWGGLIQQY